MDWIEVSEQMAPENVEVLVYTDDNKMRVARHLRGQWNTYLKVTHWQELPKKPKKKKKGEETDV